MPESSIPTNTLPSLCPDKANVQSYNTTVAEKKANNVDNGCSPIKPNQKKYITGLMEESLNTMGMK